MSRSKSYPAIGKKATSVLGDYPLLSWVSNLCANMGGASYQWVNCPSYTAIAGATAQTYTPSTSGSYAVIISNGTSCKDTSACVAVIGTNINENSLASQVKLYPNPASNLVTLSNLTMGQNINIINTLGVSVFNSKTDNSTMTIDVNAFASGMYFVQIVQDGQLLATRKLLISK